MTSPVYPSLSIPPVDSNWFNADPAVDEEGELAALEKEHSAWISDISSRDSDLLPTGQEEYNEEGEEEEDSAPEDDEEESDTGNEEEDEEEVEEIEMP